MQRSAALQTLALGAVLLAAPAAAQEPGAQASRHQLSLELGVLSVGADYAHRLAPRTLLGVGGGVGLQVLSHVFAGPHFRDDWSNDKAFDLYEGRLFVRQELASYLTLDVGVRGARVLHVFGGDAETPTHAFVGGYVAPMLGGRFFQLGPTVSAGVFTREDGTDGAGGVSELGVRLTALTGRFTFRF